MNIREIKNSNLLLGVAIFLLILSFFNFIFFISNSFDSLGFTGNSIETATANVEIQSEANIDFYIDSTNWGAGRVNSSQGDYAIINTEGVINNGTWNPNNQPLVLYNLGNANVSIDLRASNTPENFIGGVGGGGPIYQIKVSNNETGSCSLVFSNFSDYEDILTTDLRTCDNLQFFSDSDSLNIDIQLGIPSDADSGTKSSTITATAGVV